MKPVVALRSALTALPLLSLLTACQNMPSHPSMDGPGMQHGDRMYAHGPDPRERRMHFWQWRHHMNEQMQQACDGKAAGQPVTITLQNGKAITGTCTLRFKPDMNKPANPS